MNFISKQSSVYALHDQSINLKISIQEIKLYAFQICLLAEKRNLIFFSTILRI